MNYIFLNVTLPVVYEISVIIFAISTVVMMLSTMSIIYKKAGKSPWTSIVPFYNQYVLCEICGYGKIMFFLSSIPVVNIFSGIVLTFKLGEKFGKSGFFSLGIFLLPVIFLPILALSDAKYQK